MGDTTKQVDSAPPEIQNLRRNFVQYLSQPGTFGQTGATASQPQNVYIGQNQYQNPNAASPNSQPWTPPMQTNPITGQQPGTGPTWGQPSQPTTGSPTGTPTTGLPTNPPSFLSALLTAKTKAPTGSFATPTQSMGTSLQAPMPTGNPYQMTAEQQAKLGPGFGGYDPTKPPTGYDPTAWQASTGPAGTYSAISGSRMRGVATVDPATGNTTWLDAGTITPQAFNALDPNTRQRLASEMTPDDLYRVGYWTPPTGGGTPGDANAPGGFFSNDMGKISTSVAPNVAMTSPAVASQSPTLPPPNPTNPTGIEAGPPLSPYDQLPDWMKNNLYDTWKKWPPLPGGIAAVPGGASNPYSPTGGESSGPPFQTGMFESIISQLPPDMQRVVLGNPAMVDAARQAIEKYTATQSQSVDQLGGENSAFFKNMMQQLAPAFNQRRAEGLAAAKEASGNLTGSGYANALGSSINRSLGEEQATLADYATRGLQTEVQRQLQQGGLDLSAMELGQRGELANIATEMQRRGYNADQINRFILSQAGMDQDRIKTIYTSALANNQFNANQFLQGLMGVLGIKNDVQTSGGIGSVLGPIISTAPYWIPAVL